jgi:gluconolactonase
MRRRGFLQFSVMSVIGFLLWVGLSLSPGWATQSQEPIPGIGPVGEIVRAQMTFVFTEGPATDLEGNVYFSDVQRNRIHTVNTQGELSLFLENTQGCNGLMFDATGRLIAAQSGAGRIIAIDVKTKEIKVVADQYQGARFNSPNDLVIDRQGGIYFTDPSFGGQPFQDRQGVYYINAEGQVTRVIDNLTRPNGVILSTDEKTLYVLHGQPSLMFYPVVEPGQLGEGKILAMLQGTGGGDGMTIDTKGNLYLTRPNSRAIQVVNPKGESLGLISFAESPSNVTFGGPELKTLFVTARTSLYTAPMEAVGHRFAKPKEP